MRELLRCRAMESMCRQRASFYPGEAWKFLAEAEMWHHRAMDVIAPEHRVDEHPGDEHLHHVISPRLVAGRASATVPVTTSTA